MYNVCAICMPVLCAFLLSILTILLYVNSSGSNRKGSGEEEEEEEGCITLWSMAPPRSPLEQGEK